MTARTATVRARVTPTIKTEAESILKKLGLSVSEAINLFLMQIKLTKGVPFDIKIPNEETKTVFEETDKGIGLVKCENADDMFEKLGI